MGKEINWKGKSYKTAILQLYYTDIKLEHLISKRKFLIEVIQDCESTLQKLGAAIMSDIMTC